MLILLEKSWKSKLDLDLDLDLVDLFVLVLILVSLFFNSQHYKGVECLLKRHQMIRLILVLMRLYSPGIELRISHPSIWLCLIDKTVSKQTLLVERLMTPSYFVKALEDLKG